MEQCRGWKEHTSAQSNGSGDASHGQEEVQCG